MFNISSLKAKPTWNTGQWFMKMPTDYSDRMIEFCKDIFPLVDVEIGNIEVWCNSYEKRYMRFYIYLKGGSRSNHSLLSKRITSLLGESLWFGNNSGVLPHWTDNKNNYPECSFESPFTILQVGKYTELVTTEYDGLFDFLEGEWERVPEEQKRYFEELKNGHVDWRTAISTEPV